MTELKNAICIYNLCKIQRDINVREIPLYKSYLSNIKYTTNKNICIYLVLKSLGMSDGNKGEYFLIEAIKMALNQSFNAKITEIYKKIASKYSSTYATVEKEIRFTIDDIFKSMNPEILNAFFNKKTKPGNLEFIFIVADILTTYSARFDENITKCIKYMLNKKTKNQLIIDWMQEILSKEEIIDFCILRKLHSLGISSVSSGFYYIREAIKINMLDSSNKKLKTDIYPIIAKKYSTTVSAVESAMRYSIETSMENIKYYTFYAKYFRKEIENGKYPKIKKFINVLSDLVK